MRALLPITAVVLLGCGVETPHARLTQSIYGGVPAPDDHAVFQLRIDGDNDAGTTCSAALIAPRTLLTAAHCIDPVVLGAQSVRITSGASLIELARLHPNWNAAKLENDLALLRLPEASTTQPLPWNPRPISSAGFEVRAIGFGRTENGVTDQRHAARMPVQEVLATTLRIGDLADRGICFGDSGGPSLRLEDGVERIVGIHSAARSSACNDGFDARVDVAATFIREWLAEFEDACLPNGLCADHVCSTPDPDCVLVGERCERADECSSRACITDAQHTDAYCSVPCSEGCSNGLVCDATRAVCQRPQLPEVGLFARCIPGETFCTQASTCVNGRCERVCKTDADCDGMRCLGVCVPAPKTLPYLGVATAPNEGCSTGSGLLTFVALLLFQRRIHRSSGEVRSSLCRADSNRRGAT